MNKTNQPIIEVKHLSKVYNIGHEQKSAPGTLTFRDSITQTLRKPIELFTGHKLEQEKFWALKDVNFEVNQGDVVGIIGRNGSGKSTLLKVLSRIVEPTEGEITMRGRVASLLEVGTGFHPELTGRENVFFNGAILGMSQKEIKSKFDEIVAFSEVEKFLDTPVKFYSSGMYVRLAFAVAAHLDPDILIVDEVLAVGDAAFQKKCLGKMKDVAGQGRTVLFVSHNVSAVQSLCVKGILMASGEVEKCGKIDEVISVYTESHAGKTSIFSNFPPNREGDQKLQLGAIRLIGKKAHNLSYISGEDIKVSLELKKPPLTSSRANIHLNIFNDRGDWVVCSTGVSEINQGKLLVIIKGLNLYRGRYYVNVSILENHKLQDFIPEAFSFEIASSESMLSGVSGVVVHELN